jgi:UDP-N-acetylglucosamine 2-epimerase (non-hydrolysing)
MKVLTVLGTRPEIIRLSRVIPLLDARCDHILVHTGQNHDPSLSDIFFSGLNVRVPDISLGIRADTFGSQVGRIVESVEAVLLKERPDRVLVLGDTNSGLAAFVAKRMGISVYHLEAGNRCFDDRVPEEVNRRVIDTCSNVLMPYTERSRANLLREGINSDRIYVVGNPIFEVMEAYKADIDASDVHDRLGVEPGSYVLVTTHRQENVDIEGRLEAICASMLQVARRYSWPVIWSVHPRTRSKLQSFGIDPASDEVRPIEPLGFADFVKLEQSAACVLTDSGTVQEECCIMRVPAVTLRDVTERPETIECGSNMLSGVDPDNVLRAVEVSLERTPAWTPPPEYVVAEVSPSVARIVLGYADAVRM